MTTDRVNSDLIFESFECPFISAILGPRRVGKSTLIKDYAKKHPEKKWIFFNMDILDEQMAIQNLGLKKQIQEAAKQHIGDNEKIWVVIDEAQKMPAIFDQIKVLYDDYKDLNKLKFILSGSGCLSLHQLSAETLAGRIELFYLREFSLRENVDFKYKMDLPQNSLLNLIINQASPNEIQQHIEKISPLRRELLTCLKELVIFGGLPEILKLTETEHKIKYLSNYLQTYLEKDIRATQTISDLNLYRQLMTVTAEQTGSVREDQKIKSALGCTRDTLKKYRGFLAATLMYQEIYPFIGSTLKRLIKSPKGYLTNNGLISYLTGIDELDFLEKTGLIGHRFENWFLNELNVTLDHQIKHTSIYYWRTSNGIEVDFIAEKRPDIFPFEVTYSTKKETKKVRNLRKFLDEEKNTTTGFLIYMGDYHYDAKLNIHFIPAWSLG